MRTRGGSHMASCKPRPLSAARLAWSAVCAFGREEDAASMVEYALLIALLAMVVALTLLNIGTAVRTKFSSVSSCLAANSTC
jgi:Flp pilus assembly pilin Flp